MILNCRISAVIVSRNSWDMSAKTLTGSIRGLMNFSILRYLKLLWKIPNVLLRFCIYLVLDNRDEN
ncbi:hypothetical protein V1477_002183 [Vespula maculifrons]|uniref:Uncharacterized protein n=1 Tax=Vespula maculifrons TaxID=7453 RepID=A0ABD2CVS3_VESMC